MNVAVFSGFTLLNYHFEVELEVLQELLAAGHNVTQVVCNGGLSSCFCNPQGELRTCVKCCLKREYGNTLLSSSGRLNVIDFRNFRKNIGGGDYPSFSDVNALQAFKHKNFDAGYAVASSLISKLRDPYFNTQDHRAVIRNLLNSCIDVYEATLGVIRVRQIDRFYVFNGRFDLARAVFRACQHLGVDCIIHERGSDPTKYELFVNHLPHSIHDTARRIEHCWNSAPPSEREKNAVDFYAQRTKGIVKNWRSFTDLQDGRLPEGFNPSLNNIVAFTSSEDEFASIGKEWQNPLFKNQLEGLKFLCRKLASAQGTHLYIRMHPNLVAAAKGSLADYAQLGSECNVTVIPPESAIGSYELMREASSVLTFGSTMGIEAAFWGKPSVLLGRSFYETLGSVYRPQDTGEIVGLLMAKLEPLPRLGALMYGNYMNTYGIPLKHFRPVNLMVGKFRGRDVNFIKAGRPWEVWRLCNSSTVRSLVSLIRHKLRSENAT